MALQRGSTVRSVYEPTDEDIIGLVQQQSSAAPAPAPVAAAPAPFNPVGFDWATQGTQNIAGTIYQPEFESTGQGETFEQGALRRLLRYQAGQTQPGQSYEILDPATGQSTGTGQFQSAELSQTESLILGAIATTLTAGALTPVMGAMGMSQATAALVAKAVAPTVVQAAMTGDLNLEQAARNIAVNMLAPSIGSAVSAQVQNAYFDVTENVLPNSVARAVSNAAASAAATAIQQGADTGDIGRNLIAGAIASGVGTTLNSAGIDPSVAAGIGRAAGSYVSTGDAAQSIVSGITRGMSFEDQRQIAETQRQTTEAYRDPSRAFDVPPTTTDEAAITNLMQQEAALPAAEEVATPIAVPPPSPTERVEVTGAAEQPVLDEAFATVSGVAPALSPAPAEAPIAAPAPSPSVQTVEVPGTRVPDQEILDLIQSDLPAIDIEPPVVPTAAPAPVETQDQRYEVTGTAQAPAPSAEDVVSDVAAPTPAPADQRIDITASPAPQQYTVSGSPVTDEDVISAIQTPPDQRIDITGAKDQRYTVTGSPVTEEDVIDYVPADVEQEAAPPAPTQEPFQAEDVYPTDVFSYVNKGRPTRAPSPLLTQALSPGGPGRVGLAYSRPAGEIESEVTGKKRRNVWNEASLRLRDALGL